MTTARTRKKPAVKPPQPAVIPPAKVLGFIDPAGQWCQTCDRSKRGCIVVATPLGTKTTVVCHDCITQMAAILGAG